MRINKEELLSQSMKTLGDIADMICDLPHLQINSLNAKQTALVIIDMLNGFTREGALKSPRIEALIPEITRLSRLCDEYKIKKLAFADCHSPESSEFGAYPPHCIAGSSEAEVVDEIRDIGGYTLIAKNSTNGFLEEEFHKWLGENPRINSFIIAGDCTDICIQQFATTLKAWFNRQNKKSRIIVPVNAVETFDSGLHNAELINVVSFYNMITNGIEVVQSVQ